MNTPRLYIQGWPEGCPYAPDASGNICTENLGHQMYLAGRVTPSD